jgi:hypothetical protein
MAEQRQRSPPRTNVTSGFSGLLEEKKQQLKSWSSA